MNILYPQTGYKYTTIMELELIKILLTITGSLLGLLVIVIGWIGNKIHARLDAISVSLTAIEKDLREELITLDRRVTVIETTMEHQMERRHG